MKMTFTGKPSSNFPLLVRLFSILFFILSFHPFLRVSAQEEEEVLVKPNQVPQYFLGTQLTPDNDSLSSIYDHTPNTLVTTCTNSDFSLGNFSTWAGCYGSFANGCQTAGFNNTRHVIMPRTGQIYDPWIGLPLTTVFPGETHSARLGDTAAGGHSEQLKYTVNVGQDNYLFVYRWASVLESCLLYTSDAADE